MAALRAAHRRIDGEPKILDDPVAEHLLDPAALRRMLDDPSAVQTEARRHLRVNVALRSRYAEDRLRDATAQGTTQFVVLGAGYDTFAYRLPAWAHELRIFEVDMPQTQADKRMRLARASIEPPPNLHFVPVDFETTTLASALAASTFDPRARSFFSWLGVIMYLTLPAVEEVLRFIATCGPGTEVAFTFATPGRAGSGIGECAAAVGEPWRTYLTHDDMRALLHRCGFSSVEFLSAAAAAAYAGERSDGLRAPAEPAIGCARVASD